MSEVNAHQWLAANVRLPALRGARACGGRRALLDATRWMLGIFFFLLVVSPSARSAPQCENEIVCEIANKPFYHIDKPIKVSEDCSFSRAGDGWADTLSGTKATDNGVGRVGQRWISGGCGNYESIVIADCNSREIIRVSGLCTPRHKDDEGIKLSRFVTSATLLFPPHGELRLNSKTVFGDVVRMSQDNGYKYTTAVSEQIAAMRRRNRIDPFCGCKIFYPDSAGAKQ